MQQTSTLFSGIKPTGIPHLGNYLGALKNWVDLQNSYQSIYSVVDYHAITIDIKPDILKQNTIIATKILLALGLNPEKSILFVQSHVSEHTELAWIFNCLIPVAEMERMTQYKDKAQLHKKNINMGLFDYPALMAADILLYHATAVPVGEDQLQHLELARLVARKFNQRYGQHFIEPQAVVTPAKRIMSLQKPDKKMSKELGENNYISLLDEPEVVIKKVSRAVTDTVSKNKSMSPGVKNLFDLLDYLGEKTQHQNFMQAYQQGSIKYSDLKIAVADAINQTLKPFKQKYQAISDQQVQNILKAGAQKAKALATKNLQAIKEIIGLI